MPNKWEQQKAVLDELLRQEKAGLVRHAVVRSVEGLVVKPFAIQ
jgi:hypothetical protein